MERDRSTRIIQVDNETVSESTRVTAEGKRLTYRLEVIQQPLRARACGAGAKSSADRRPVDPPPIVELKIFDGDASGTDITFNMNANYFLFATLEQARPMAHGRVPEAKDRMTVLTGTPVAGMVYLDRPKAAGYFIFPDLSVRHEGKYRLSFSLYEELKNPKDFDQVDPTTSPSESNAGDSHVTHRLEVKSIPFIVFSAKKFPGLTESTSLSRMVAEQGCRVRIRRDVRMRRRDTKGGKEWDDYEDETAPARNRRSVSPESHHGSNHSIARASDAGVQQRTESNAGHAGQANIAPMSQRASIPEMNSSYQAYRGSSEYSRGPSGQQQPSAGQYQSMQYPSQQQQQTSAMQPPARFSGPYGQAPVSQPHSGFGQAPSSQQSQYSMQGAMVQHGQPRLSVDFSSQQQIPAERRSSNQYSAALISPQMQQQPQQQQHQSYNAPPPQQTYNSSQSQAYNAPPQQHRVSNAHDVHLPPQRSSSVQSISHPNVLTTTAPSRSTHENVLPPLQIYDYASSTPSSHKLEASPASHVPSTTYSSASSTYNADLYPQKRSHGHVFPNALVPQSLRDGARPVMSYAAPSIAADADADDLSDDFDPSIFARTRMDYRRADGSLAARRLPVTNE